MVPGCGGEYSPTLSVFSVLSKPQGGEGEEVRDSLSDSCGFLSFLKL